MQANANSAHLAKHDPQPNDDLCSKSFAVAAYLYSAIVKHHQMFYDRETNPETAFTVLGSCPGLLEHFEDVWQRFIGDAHSVVLDSNASLKSVRTRLNACLTALHVQLNPSAVCGVLPSVAEHVGKNLRQSSRIGINGYGAFGQRDFERMPAPADALVFGGGHVVLPLLQQQTVATGWVSSNDFLAGYGAAQAVPGPLFTSAAFLGWMMAEVPNPWTGALLAIAGIFLPGLLLVLAALPYWQALRACPSMAALLNGVDAAVVGLLATALYSPVWTGAVLSELDFAIAVIGFFLPTRWKIPPLVVVVLCALAGIAEAA
jgi:chromate transport protein ChrA